MKILQLGKFYPIRGGVEKVMWDLTAGLSARGIDCDMLCARLPVDAVDLKDRWMLPDGFEGGQYLSDEPLVMRFNEHGRVICVPAHRKVAATMLSSAMIDWLKEHGKEYDVIHVHHPDPMACLALWMSHYKGKVVLHWHSDILKQKGLLKMYLPLQRWLIRRADRIVGTTPVYVRESPYLQNSQDKVDYIPIGVNEMQPDHVKVERIKSKYPGKKIIYSLGRLVGYKGYDYLVEAMKYLPDNYQLVIGGQGPLEGELQRKASSLGVSDRVEFLGWVEDDDSASWFGACDVFVLSSIWKTEAFAIVQVEAMSCGKPVVATKISGSGVPWVNADGVSGLNVPVEDSKALADAIFALTGDEAVYASFGAAARKRYEELFTYSRMIDNCLEIYNSL